MEDQSAADSTPQDVAALYSWANLQGAKYRDYSASRREYRAQVRYRAAKALLERELRAQVEAETAAAEAERSAAAGETGVEAGQAAHATAVNSADDRARKASRERVEAARRAEAAARAAVLALREEREIADAHSSARRQALVYEQSDLRRRQLAGPQPRGFLGEPYSARGTGPADLRIESPASLQGLLFSGWEELGADPGSATGSMDFGAFQQAETGPAEPGELRAKLPAFEDEGPNAPAWLFPSLFASRVAGVPASTQVYRTEPLSGDTLQDSRERVASRWFALKGLFEKAGAEFPAMQPPRARDGQIPVLAVFSLAGGVGKTSLVATLARALSAQGEKVVMTDTTAHGLLPIYFGSPETRAGVLRTFPPRPESSDPAISMLVHDLAEGGQDERRRQMLTDEIVRSGGEQDRLLLDVSSGTSWVIQRMVNLHPTVLVPLAPDMNSVMSLQRVERLFRSIADRDGRPLLPFYVLNHFDASLPLHLDVREVLRRQIGDRLLRYAIRRSQAVSEALAEGMTVLDYAPDAPVAQDYRDVAGWLKSVAPSAREGLRSMRRVDA